MGGVGGVGSHHSIGFSRDRLDPRAGAAGKTDRRPSRGRRGPGKRRAPRRSAGPRSTSGSCDQILETFAACLPLGPETRSNSTRSPSASERKPLAPMAEKWTNTSSPLSVAMNPKPFASLNHFTEPCTRPSEGPVGLEARAGLVPPPPPPPRPPPPPPWPPPAPAPAPVPLDALKQSRHSTARPAVGMNGTSVSRPQFEQVAGYI